ncbi:MAG: hypothetical protein HY825_13680 [Acidobacteria bacterium]|nr:hypothetical protein [Acidobacteriota bacterium]
MPAYATIEERERARLDRITEHACAMATRAVARRKASAAEAPVSPTAPLSPAPIAGVTLTGSGGVLQVVCFACGQLATAVDRHVSAQGRGVHVLASQEVVRQALEAMRADHEAACPFAKRKAPGSSKGQAPGEGRKPAFPGVRITEAEGERWCECGSCGVIAVQTGSHIIVPNRGLYDLQDPVKARDTLEAIRLHHEVSCDTLHVEAAEEEKFPSPPPAPTGPVKLPK